MRTTLFSALVVALGACAPNYDTGYGDYPGEAYPPAAPYPPEPLPIPPTVPDDETYRAIGTEPFWDLNIGRELVFTDRGNGLTVIQQPRARSSESPATSSERRGSKPTSPTSPVPTG